MLKRTVSVLVVITSSALVTACGGGEASTTQIAVEQQPGRGPESVLIAAAGDIACPAKDDEFQDGEGVENACQQQAVADLVERANPDAVLPLGDTQYDYGTAEEYATSYDLSWGKFLPITHAAVGNHEYLSSKDAHDYFEYFGAAAGPDTRGYYSFDLGTWHLVSLNTNCGNVEGGCDQGSPQEKWLRADLTDNAKLCTLAFLHHPLYSSSRHGNNDFVQDLWATLYEYRVDVVLAGHDHVYERFAPQDPNGNTSDTGVREFVVGTGGKEHYNIRKAHENSVTHDDHTFGVLTMTLRPRDYSWSFLPIPGSSYHDSGSAKCH